MGNSWRGGELGEKLRLYGFNNLTKSLSLSIYDVCYTEGESVQQDYIASIDEQYNYARLTEILLNVTEQIGAQVLNISGQDYEPQGASVNLLIAEDEIPEDLIDPSNNRGKDFGTSKPTPASSKPSSIHAHLDKSHVTVHSFPESHPNRSISTFRGDIDVSTCGKISPLSTLDYLIASFDSDVITIDYKVRGFTRDENGKKHFMDHAMRSIQDYIDPEILRNYDTTDINFYQSNLFHTRMMLKELELANYLFNIDPADLTTDARSKIEEQLQHEIIEIYNGVNIYDEWCFGKDSKKWLS